MSEPVTVPLPPEAEIPLPGRRGTVKVPLASLPGTILAALVYHGARQKIADAYAGSKDETTGPAEAIISAWLAGQWSRKPGTVGRPPSANAEERRAVIAAATAFARANPRPGVSVEDRVKAAVAAWFDPDNPKHEAVKAALGEAVKAALEAARRVREAAEEADGMAF